LPIPDGVIFWGLIVTGGIWPPIALVSLYLWDRKKISNRKPEAKE